MTTITVSCDMATDCKEPITHIDIKGYIYCSAHGKERQSYQRCRKLTPAELKVIQAGEPLKDY